MSFVTIIIIKKMEITKPALTDWKSLTQLLGRSFKERAAVHDEDGKFVYENYEQLKAHDYFSLLIPQSLGGAGLAYSEVCDIIRILAQHCGSTALAFSMHQHLVAATVWKFIHKGEGAALLQKVADQQIVLVSTGARDWLGSNGEMKKVEGGYRLNARKHFASQSAGGDVAVTSAPYQNEVGEWKVLHFAVPFSAEGVNVLDDWDVMSMRGTGSQTIEFADVFVPDIAISLERPKDEFHPVWNLIIVVAMPLIMSTYVGIAERALEIAVSLGKTYGRNQKHMTTLLGKIYNELTAARCQWKAMVDLTNNFEVGPDDYLSAEIVTLKTNVADACISAVSQAMEAIGGQSIYRRNELERLFRDVQASMFHPMPKWEQYEFTGAQLLSGKSWSNDSV